MNRAVKTLVLVAIAEMAAVHIAILVARWGDISHFSGLTAFEQRCVFALAFFPLWLVFGLIFQARQVSKPSFFVSDEHRVFQQWGLGVLAVFLTLCHNFLASGMISEPLTTEVSPKRLLLLLAGLITLVYGNYRPKVAPPAGLTPTAHGAWDRAARLTGWMMVLFGVAQVVCALALPDKPQMIALIVLVPVPFVIAIREWRLTARHAG